MKTRLLFLIPAITLALSSCGSRGAGPVSAGSLDSTIGSGKELASLGNAEIHEGFLQLLGRVNPNIEGQTKTPAGKKRLVDSLLEQELFYKESVRRGIDKSPQVQEKAALYQRVIISQALLDEEIKKKSKEYYDANKDKEFARVKLAQILIRPKPPAPTALKPGQTPPKPDMAALDAEAAKRAQEAKAKLDSGTSWEEVVTTYSDDPASKNKGGDLGYISREDRRVSRLGWDEIIQKAFAMKEGEISGPLKAKDGYHIIKLEETSSVAPYEEVQASIEFKLRPQVKNETLANLSKGKATEYEDPELKNLASAPPPIPGMPGEAHPTININPAQQPNAPGQPAAKQAKDNAPTPKTPTTSSGDGKPKTEPVKPGGN